MSFPFYAILDLLLKLEAPKQFVVVVVTVVNSAVCRAQLVRVVVCSCVLTRFSYKNLSFARAPTPLVFFRWF